MTVFLVLSGMALVFMLYVLVNFWKEGRRTARTGIAPPRNQLPYGSYSEVFVVTRPLKQAAGRTDRSSVIRFPGAKASPQLASGMSTEVEPKTPPRKYSSG
jgi:hypothetical protein